MGRYERGDIVYIPFSFTDSSQSKVRPALIVAEVDNEVYILCMITKKPVSDKYAITIIVL